MLQTLREHSGSWFVKIFLGLIAVSFALWGVSDVIFGYTNMRPVAKVDGQSIPQEELAHLYDREISLIQQRSKGKAVLDDEKKAEIQRYVLDDLINQAVVRHTVDRLGLAVTDAYIRQAIQKMPKFTNNSGKFDKQLFDQTMLSNGMTEAAFIQNIRSTLMTIQLFGTLSSGARLPKFYITSLFSAEFDQKKFLSVHVPLSKMKIEEKPTNDDLQNLYKQNQDQFTKPETRKLDILIVDPSFMKEQITLSESQLQDDYQKRRAEFIIPEKRHVQQIASSSAQNLENVSQAFDTGRPMISIARNTNSTYTDLPETTKDQLPTEAQDIVFSLPKGQVSEVIQVENQWNVYVVLSSEPEKIQAYEEVREQLLEDARNQQMSDFLYELRNKIEDGIAGGAKFSEIASDLKLQLESYPAVDKNGKDPSGKMVLPHDLAKQILEQAFELQENSDSPVIDLPGGSMLLVHVEKITPPFLPNFDDIKPEIEEFWMESKQQKAAAELAQDLASQIGSSAFTAKAKKYGLTVEKIGPLNRSESIRNVESSQHFPDSLKRLAFGLKQDQAVSGPAKSGFMVVMLEETIPVDLNKISKKYEQFETTLLQLAQRDIDTAYLKSIRKDLENKGKIDINDTILLKMRHRE